MSETMKKPRIRFKGFTEAWEQRKLGEIFEEYSEKNHEELPALTILQGGGTIRRDESERALQYDKKSLSNYKKVNVGDFIVHLRSFEGGLEMATNTGIVSPAYHIFHGEKVDSRFYYSYFRSRKFIDTDLKPHVYGIRDGRSIDIEGMKTIEIPWTDPNEQKVIGDCIDAIDNLITLHQRKYDKLLNIKKSMLEKMFPKNGNDVPEIRFKGFTDAWEQRKLGELGSLKNGMNFSKEAMGVGFPFVNLQNIFGNNVIDVSDLGKAIASESQLKDYNLLEGDALFVRSSVKLEGVGEAAIVPHNLENTTYSGFIIRFRDEYGLDNDFKRFVFGIESVRNQIMAQATNSANKNISQSVLENLDLAIPSKSEQQKIGAYFNNLDHLITLHQRKLEKLKNIKKSMLEKMFV